MVATVPSENAASSLAKRVASRESSDHDLVLQDVDGGDVGSQIAGDNIYVFGTAEELEDLSRTMVQADYTLAMALEDSRASVPRGRDPVGGGTPTTDVGTG